MFRYSNQQNPTEKRTVSQRLEQTNRQWDVDVPFQTDPQNGMTSEGYILATSLLPVSNSPTPTPLRRICRCLVAK